MPKSNFKYRISSNAGAVVLLSLLLFSLPSCSGLPKNLPQIDAMVITGQYSTALEILEDDTNAYGKNNELLYLLDKGFIQHLNRDYEASINTFAKAQLIFDRLYTESISKIAATWVINDYAAPYHGEDFEYVFINIFQALNYIMLGNYEDALVEARDVDSKLNAINAQYKQDQKNVYKEDAFARLLMGIIYEAGDTNEDLNDAFISYVKSEETYERDYSDNYNLVGPNILKENILTTARFMGLPEFSKYRMKYKNMPFYNIKEKRKKAEVYLIQYNGLCPIKVEDAITIPTPDGHVIKVAFPRYQERVYGIADSRLLATSKRGQVYYAHSEVCQDIGMIAIKNLERRKVRFIAKSALRSTGRYLVEKKQEENVEKKHGAIAAGWFSFFSNIYNLIIEQADLRCWQTLPDQIRIARLLIAPGDYEFSLENFNKGGAHLGEVKLAKASLRAGQRIFFLIHTSR